MPKFIYNITSKRYLSIKFDTVDVIRRVTRGLPQGSVFSPLLYNIYMVSLDKRVKGICRVLQFADDMVIYTMDTSPDDALPKMENSPRLSRYLNDSGL
jgi:retron-type reverse transcriptase